VRHLAELIPLCRRGSRGRSDTADGNGRRAGQGGPFHKSKGLEYPGWSFLPFILPQPAGQVARRTVLQFPCTASGAAGAGADPRIKRQRAMVKRLVKILRLLYCRPCASARHAAGWVSGGRLKNGRGRPRIASQLPRASALRVVALGRRRRVRRLVARERKVRQTIAVSPAPGVDDRYSAAQWPTRTRHGRRKPELDPGWIALPIAALAIGSEHGCGWARRSGPMRRTASSGKKMADG